MSAYDNAVKDAKCYLEHGVEFDGGDLVIRNQGLSRKEAELAIQQAQAQIGSATTTAVAVLEPKPQSLSKVPHLLKSIPNWIWWRLETKDGKPTKVPYVAGNWSRHASSTDPSTWTAFENAMNGAVLSDTQGVGFVIHGVAADKKIVGFDLDGCRNPETGALTQWAQELISVLGSYAEVTPSQTGIRVWVCGELPQGLRVFNLAPACGFGDKVKIEVFGSGRYFTVTGDVVDDAFVSTDVESRDLVAAYELCHNIRNQFPAQAKVSGADASAADNAIRDSVQIQLGGKTITNKTEILMHGRILSTSPFVVSDEWDNQLEYPSHSEADMSLCTLLAFEGLDVNQIDEQFRLSALYREKWERDGYRTNTIQKAIESTKQAQVNRPVEVITSKPAAIDEAKERLMHITLPEGEFWDYFNSPFYRDEAGQLKRRTSILELNPTVTHSEPKTQMDNSEASEIPAFDPTVMNGIYKEWVEALTAGTTLAPQFLFGAIKTVVGLRMSGKVKFETLTAEPRLYFAAIGETGSGKGEAWRRVKAVLEHVGSTRHACGVKIMGTGDSGAGLRDLFFDPPELPILSYVDEVKSLGDKSRENKNPDILNTMVELADTTFISRTKVGSAKNRKVKDDARLACYMCGQDSDVYANAFSSVSDQGFYDRLYPEFGTPQPVGDLSPVEPMTAANLLMKLNSLDYTGTISMSAQAKARLSEFWRAQDGKTRLKARWHNWLLLDAYMSAFGRGSKEVATEDAERAIKICQRQLIIRRVFFGKRFTNVVGQYIGKLKELTETMEQRLAHGVDPKFVALSKRDFTTKTKAYAKNELAEFHRAWDVWVKDYLRPVTVVSGNGQQYPKFLPAEREP